MYLDEYYEALVDASLGGYVFIGIDDHDGCSVGLLNTGKHVAYNVDGQIVKAIRLMSKRHVLHYVKLTDLTKFTEKTCLLVGGVLTGNLTCWFKTKKASGYDDLTVMNNNIIERSKKLKYTYKIKNKNKEKITQYHHLHVRLIDLYCNKSEVTLTGCEAILALYLDRFSENEATHATFLLYYHSLPIKERDLFINLCYSYKCINREWLKKEGVMAKQSQHGTMYDLSKLFELNVLENRVTTEIDWEKEKINRTCPKTVPLEYGDVYRLAARLFSDALTEGRRPMGMSWNDYWQQRAVIMPAGAVHSRHEEDLDIITTLPRAAKSKKGFVSTLGELDQEYFLSRPCEITAHTSTKYEWGKTRALYGCDITSHINADFGLMMCEDTFPSYIPTGSNSKPEHVKLQIDSMTGVPLCYDYDDFNSQHSISAMQAVIDAWRSTFASSLTIDQHKAVEWTIKSIEKMYVKQTHDKLEYQAKGTLFSGWRLTSFINTVLNYVYLDNASLRCFVYKSVHNGDDVYASARSVGDAVELIERAESSGVRAQKSKMNIGTIAEFLRMDMRAKNCSATQYLTRGCATFVHSRIESDAPYSLRNMVAAYYTRYNELIARGCEKQMANKCYRKQLFFSRKLFETDKDVIDKLVTYDLVAGGVVPGGKITDEKIEEYVVSKMDEDFESIKTLTRKGVESYTSFLKRKFKQIEDAFSYSVVLKNTLNMYKVYKKSCRIVKADMYDMLNEKALKGAWSRLPGILTIHKVRMGISNIVIAMSKIRPDLAHVLSKSGDPLKWMKILL